MRGFQSSMDYRMHFGLGQHDKVDSLIVEWPEGRREVLQDVSVDQLLKIKPKQSSFAAQSSSASTLRLRLATTAASLFTTQLMKNIRHKENRFSDFDRDPLMYQMLSTTTIKVQWSGFTVFMIRTRTQSLSST